MLRFNDELYCNFHLRQIFPYHSKSAFNELTEAEEYEIVPGGKDLKKFKGLGQKLKTYTSSIQPPAHKEMLHFHLSRAWKSCEAGVTALICQELSSHS